MPVSVGELLGYLRLDSSGFDRGITVAQQEMRSAAGVADRLSAAVGSTGERLTAAGRQANITATGSAKLRAAQLSLIAAQERYNTVLGQSDASLGRLASAEAAVVRANERVAASTRGQAAALGEARAAVDTMPATLAKTTSGLLNATRAAVGLGVAFGVFEAASKAIEIGKEASAYQADMVRIRALTGASTDEIHRMNSALLGLSGKVAQAPDQLATSLYHVEAIGLRDAQALDAVTVAAKGARIGNADLEETTNALTATIQSGIAKNQSFTDTMSDLLTIVGTGDMKLSDFNDSLSTGLLATMANAGVDLRDVGAALAVFGDNNIRGANAATMLRVAVQALQQPAKGGAAALDLIGIKADTLRNDLSKGGLNAAISDLRDHLHNAGYDGERAGALIVEAFGKKANTGIGVLIHEYDLLQQKYGMLDHGAQTFAQRWDAVSQTTSFKLAQLGHEAEAAGISLAEKATPAVGALASLLVHGLPAGLHVAGAALSVFHDGADAAGAVVGPLAHGLGDVVHALGPLAPIAGSTASGVLAMWLAFKGYQVARAAVFAVQDGVATMSANVRNRLAGMRGDFGATRAQLATQSAVMRAEFAQIEAAALADAAATDRAAAMKAVAYADETAASKAATDAQVRNADMVASAALAQARASAEAAAASAAAATVASAEIDAAGSRAALGWSAMLGPIGLVAVGVLTVASMFHRSSAASKEATEAAKAYTDALKSGTRADLIDSITKQLSNNKVPETIRALNEQLGHTAVSGRQFVTAIQSGGQPLADLRAKLEGIVKSGTTVSVMVGRTGSAMKMMTPEAKSAAKLLGDLNAQYDGLSKAAKKDLLDTKAFAGVSSSIDKVSDATKVGSDTARTYATMMGIVVDKNGVAAVSAKDLQAAVSTVSNAYATATQTGDAFLSALNTFSQSAGTAADRATLIGATLKASNGDALNFAGQMNASAVALRQLRKDADDAAKSAVKGGESTRAWLDSIVNLKTGTIDYSKAGAAPLITDLQGIQTAGMNAAQAMYQHARSTMSAKDAADAAYKVYVGQTRGQLIDQLEKLGATSGEAKKLADRYLGMPKQVKTAIEAEGTNPIVDVLNKIGRLLANLTGQTWDVGVNVIVSEIVHATAGVKGSKGSDPRLGGHAAGTNGRGVPDGVSAVGEDGAELLVKRGPHVEVLNHRQALGFLAATGVKAPGFAGGTTPSKKYELGDVTYKTKSEYQSALNSATSSIAAVLAAARNMNASAADMRSAVKDLRSAAHDQKLSAAFQKELASAAGRLDTLAARRDRLRAQLGSAPTAPTAYERLEAEKQQYATDQDNYRSAVLGFDLTSVTMPDAGPTTSSRRVGGATITTTTPSTGPAPLTASALIAADAADVARAQAFDKATHKLVEEGLNSDDVAQIAAKGPSALEYAQALAKSTPAQVRRLNSLDKQRTSAANDVGTFLAKKFDQAGVDSAQGYVNGLVSQLKGVETAADRLAETVIKRVKKKLGIKSPSRVAFEIGAYVGEGAVNGLHHKIPHVQAAADRLAGAMVPAVAGLSAGEIQPAGTAGTAGGGAQLVMQVYGQPGQSPSEIAHIASSDLMFHLDR